MSDQKSPSNDNPHDPSRAVARSPPEIPPNSESHLRSFLKALSWRIVATTTTTLIAYFIGGSVSMALSIGGAEFVIKFFIYYAHERIWQLVPRGAVRRRFARHNA